MNESELNLRDAFIFMNEITTTYSLYVMNLEWMEGNRKDTCQDSVGGIGIL